MNKIVATRKRFLSERASGSRAGGFALASPGEKDRFGLPVPNVSFNLHDNGKKLIKTAKGKTMGLAALS